MVVEVVLLTTATAVSRTTHSLTHPLQVFRQTETTKRDETVKISSCSVRDPLIHASS